MIRHILRKDWLLLWPLGAGLAILQGLVAFARYKVGHFPAGFPGTPASLLVLLASAIVIVLVAHQDPIPGTRQDWLVRPISRRDLFLAKLIFVVVLVQGPWLVTDVVQGLANGFPLWQSARSALACTGWVLVSLSIPVLAFAALTGSTTEMLVAGVGVVALMVALLILPAVAGATAPTALSGFGWVPTFARQMLLLGAAIGVLLLQYRWRRTWAARTLFAGALLAGQAMSFLPWSAAFRLEQLLSASSADEPGIDVAFAPAEGKLRLAAGQGLDDIVEKPGFGPADVAAENQRRRAEGARTIFLPVHLSGLIPDSRLLADRLDVKLIDRDGRVIHQGKGNDLELRGTSADATAHQGIRVPGVVFGRFKDEPLDLQLDYSFTLFRPTVTYALAARDGDQRMPGIGWCATRVDEAGTRVLFRCLQPGERPSCVTMVLEHAATRQRNPEVSMCAPDYSPFPGHVLPDALSRFGGTLPFYDPSGSMRYAVGGPQLDESRVIVTNFVPANHFLRRIVIRGVRLRDWEPQT